MPRQLYGLGSLVKSVTKAAKGVVRGIKDVAKSDVGKLALTAGALYGLGGGTFFGKGLPGLIRNPGTFSFGNILPNAMGYLVGAPGGAPGAPDIKGLLGVGGKFSNFAKTAALTIPAVLAAAGVEEDEVEAIGQDKNKLAALLEQGYKNLNPGVSDEEVDAFVRANVAEGGRIGYANGSEDYEDRFMKLVGELMEAGFSQQEAIEEARERLSKNMAMGGRMKYAMGDSAEQNAMQASGIMGLPLNENPAGITELDLRETGGFIPPVGVKEKADDIPAMLSNNEFVFTADAVRGMGGGDVDKGAERMYAMMKTLENGGRV